MSFCEVVESDPSANKASNKLMFSRQRVATSVCATKKLKLQKKGIHSHYNNAVNISETVKKHYF